MGRQVFTVDDTTKLPPTAVVDALRTAIGGGSGGSGSTLVYANGAYPARPSSVPAGGVTYVGPVQPTTWLAGDEWRDIS